ncbi:FAD-dependent oxidoreductase [Candidatus Peregrinibacteria bacterium]|nr:MAG: FAD-dependent oxidoreductase [Candidatus Peregrinibacteria bacterium]
MNQTDFLIIGSGIAGLSAAYFLKDKGSVTVVTKGKLREANTYWAQGGVAAVMLPEDSFESHIQDTLKAGSYLNDEKAVRVLVEHAPRSIRFLKSIGVPFQQEPALEAAHSHARVWHTSDFTGQDILNHLIKQVTPTAVDHLDAGRYFLLSETLRGFGAKIVNEAGVEFLKGSCGR